MITETAMSITEALLGMDTVTCETPEEVSHMMATGESQLEARGRESEWRRLSFTLWTQIEQVAKERTKWKELTCGLTHLH